MRKKERISDKVSEENTSDSTIDLQAPSSLDDAEDKVVKKMPTEKTIDDLGPTMTELKWRRKIWPVISYAYKHQKARIVIMGIFIFLLFALSALWGELRFPSTSSHTPEGVVEWMLNAAVFRKLN